RMVRTFPPACRWQSLRPQGRERKTVRGHPLVGGWYEWKGERYVPSWGGSMFEALMPTLVVDEAHHAPLSLGANDAAHVAVQRRSGLAAHAQLALAQAMTFSAAANYLRCDCIRRGFAADPIGARALAVIGEERFFD